MKNLAILALSESLLLILAGALEAQPPARQATAATVETVRARTGQTLSWEQDAAAREENQRAVKALLQRPLTASSASQIALLNNRDLQATFEDLGVAAADFREAGMWKNPSLNLSIRFPDRPPSATDAEEGVAFDLLDLLMIPLRKRVAEDRLRTAQLRVSDAALKLIAQVKTEIYTVQAGGQLVARLKTIQETSAAATELTQKQHEAGNITDLALIQQQANYSQSRLDVAMAEADVRQHREVLNRLLSLWGLDTGWKISESLPSIRSSDPSLHGLESIAIGKRLDLAAARSELVSIVRALGLTKSYRFIGALDFGVDTEHNPDHSNVTGPTLRLELPLLNQGQARIARGEAELRRAERKFEGLAIDIRSEVRERWDQLSSKRDVVQSYQDQILPSRTAIVKQTQLAFNGMLISNYDLFTAKSEELRAERGYIEALRDYWIARAELERALGGSLTERSRSTEVRATDGKSFLSSTRKKKR